MISWFLARHWALYAGVVLCGACAASDIPIRSSEPVRAITLSPTSDTLQPSEATQLSAAPRDSRGRPLAERTLIWSSTDPSVAHVSPQGLVIALTPGAAQISVSSEGQTATSLIRVLPLTGPAAECATPKRGWIWCDDFDDDRLARYSNYESRESFHRTAGAGYGGSVGMRARFNTVGQVNAGFIHLHFGKTPAPDFRPVDAGTEVFREIYWRVFVRYSPWWIGGGGNKLSRAQSMASKGWAQAMIAHVWAPGQMPDHLAIEPASAIRGGRLVSDHYNDFTKLVFLPRTWSKTPIFDRTHLGKWHCIEAHARLNDPDRSNGVFELWINERLEARQSGLGWMGSFTEYGINAIYLENYWNEGAPQPQERDFDNFVVSTTPIGCR